MKKTKSACATRCSFLAVLVALLAACSVPKPMPLGAARAQLTTLRAEARVEVKRGNRRAKFHASILASFPDKLFVETSGFGFPAALLSSEGNRTRVYVPSERRGYESLSDDAIQSLLGISLPTREWISLLMGKPISFSGEVIQDGPLDTAFGSYPSHTRLSSGDLSVDLRFKEVRANPDISKDLYRLDFPRGVVAEPLKNTQLWPD